MSWRHIQYESDGGSLRLTSFERSAPRAGPTVVVLAGVHGDEFEPMLAAGALIRTLPKLLSGTLRVVPVCNAEALRVSARRSPADGQDLARSFPGNTSGTFTERLAYLIWTRILADAELVIDLHSAGFHYEMPLLVGCKVDASEAGERSFSSARVFGVPTVWVHDEYAPGRTVTAATENGAAAIYAECGGGPSADPANIEAFLRGVQRVLRELRMIPGIVDAIRRQRILHGSGDLDTNAVRAGRDGFFRGSARAGAIVDRDAVVGAVYSVDGAVLEEIVSPDRGCLVMVRRTTAVRTGDPLVSFAELSSLSRLGIRRQRRASTR